MLLRFSKGIVGRYLFSNVTKRPLFSTIKDKPVTNFRQAFDLIDGAYQSKYTLPYPTIRTMLTKTEKVLFHSPPSYKFIRLYLIFSRLKLMDNFHRKLFVQKIIGCLDRLSDEHLVNACYFLITHCPHFDLVAMEDYSLRLQEIRERMGGRSFGEYLFGMKTDLVVKYCGHETKGREIPNGLQSQDVGRVLALPHCISELNPIDQATFDRVQKFMYIFLQNQTSQYLAVQSKTNQQDTFIHDSFLYEDLCILYQIFRKMDFESQIQNKINSVFYRKMHESEIDFMSAVRILKCIMPYRDIQSFNSIIKTIFDVVWNMEKDQLIHVPAKSIVEFLGLIRREAIRKEMLGKFEKVISKIDVFEKEELLELEVLYEGEKFSEEIRGMINSVEKQ